MNKRSHFCTTVKAIAVELVSLAGFLAILGVVVYCEFNHLVAYVRR